MNTLKIVINPHSSLLRTQTRQNTEHQRSCTITHQINKSEQLPGSTKRRLLNSNCRYYLFPLRGVAGVINSSRKWSKATVHFGSGRALRPWGVSLAGAAASVRVGERASERVAGGGEAFGTRLRVAVQRQDEWWIGSRCCWKVSLFFLSLLCFLFLFAAFSFGRFCERVGSTSINRHWYSLNMEGSDKRPMTRFRLHVLDLCLFGFFFL